jgi:hypothetical protein
LPKEVIAELTKSKPAFGRLIKAKHSLLVPEEVEAENAFAKVCQDHGDDVVGVWDGRPIHYPLFVHTPLPLLSQELMHAAKWDQLVTPNDICVSASAEKAIEKADPDRHQQLGYAGKLTFDADYQHERNRLIEAWRTLPVSLPWPYYATTCERVSSPQCTDAGTASLTPAAVAFAGELGTFLRKWQLAGLVTWDLPLPQGRLEGISLNLAAHLLGSAATVNTIPTYHDIAADADLRREIREQQASSAAYAGIGAIHPVTDIAPRQGHPSMWDTAFRLWFLEHAARSRYGDRKRMCLHAVAAIFDLRQRLSYDRQALLHAVNALREMLTERTHRGDEIREWARKANISRGLLFLVAKLVRVTVFGPGKLAKTALWRLTDNPSPRDAPEPEPGGRWQRRKRECENREKRGA